ncbi:RluA family pseudouridine synthase [Saprospiraceae bacterium]|nr:RluA family pseudouridine synthase [Saprospiraceae bacterium]MDA9332863.1 RluA family pseudouridine synthase [Saprospiraceae bacterium]MDB4163430.1 RluA family pseudouridine synthase [Saprospiraceae bacterium]MDC1309238.1 RluA family pseudouridine synthase [Saprospiraceae bacterium]
MKKRKKLSLNVLFEDNHIIAVEKTAGMLVHGDETGDRTLQDHVKTYIKKKYNKPGDVFLGVIHRLDRPVSGVTIFARTSKALTRMNALIKDREITKEYLALVSKRPLEIKGLLTHYIVKDTKKNFSHIYDKMKNGAKKALLRYEMVGQISGYVLMRINLETGRPHQIRVQMKRIGCHIIGDVKYGYEFGNVDKSICLHCSKMSFIHPIKKDRITIKLKPPKNDFWDIFIGNY